MSLERNVHDIRRSYIAESSIRAEQMKPLLLEARSALRQNITDPLIGSIDVMRVATVSSALRLGVVSEEEVATSLTAHLDSLPKIEEGTACNDVTMQAHNAVYGKVLDFTAYKSEKYFTPSYFVPWLEKVNINLLDRENMQKVSNILERYAFLDLNLFPNLDLSHAAHLQYQSAKDAFLSALASTGNAPKVFEYITKQPTDDSSNFDQSLITCAEMGLQEEVIQLTTQLLSNHELERVSNVLAACAGFDKETADKIHRLIQPFREQEAYDIVLSGCIFHGYADEAFERAVENPSSLFAPYQIAEAIAANPSLAKKGLEFIKTFATENYHMSLTVIQACIRNGQHQEVLELFKAFPQLNVFSYDLLETLYEDGLVDQAEKYIASHVPPPQDRSNRYLSDEKSKFMAKCEEDLIKVGDDKHESEKVLLPLDTFLNGLTLAEFQFYRLIVEKYGLLDPHMLEFISNHASRAEVFKTGSSLTLLQGDCAGIFVNRVPDNSARIWKALAEEMEDPVPIAPIVKLGNLKNDWRIVFSRYCGPDFNSLIQRNGLDTRRSNLINLFIATAPHHLAQFQEIENLYGFRNPFIKDVVSQVNHIVEELESRGIAHGHPHPGNFTIELIDKKYLEQQLAGSKTINTIPYDEDKFTFDFMRHNELDAQGKLKWIPVVRLIDLDLISQKENTAS